MKRVYLKRNPDPNNDIGCEGCYFNLNKPVPKNCGRPNDNIFSNDKNNKSCSEGYYIFIKVKEEII